MLVVFVFLSNWWPHSLFFFISLLNVVYKLASICISERIKRVLDILIGEDQTGFMSDRYIGENIMILYDILYYTESHNIPDMLLRIYFEKTQYHGLSYIRHLIFFIDFFFGGGGLGRVLKAG